MYPFRCCACCLWCLEKFLKFINKNAYIMVRSETHFQGLFTLQTSYNLIILQVALYGKNFLWSAKEAFSLLMRNILR